MTETSLLEIMEALAEQIADTLCSGTSTPLIPNLQVTPTMQTDPTPPSIDVYPASPFQDGIAFGRGNVEMFFNVRARVTTADQEGGQELLLQMMDPRTDTSVALAICDDRTLGGVVENVVVTGPSDFGMYVDPGLAGSLLGCTWTVRVTP